MNRAMGSRVVVLRISICQKYAMHLCRLNLRNVTKQKERLIKAADFNNRYLLLMKKQYKETHIDYINAVFAFGELEKKRFQYRGKLTESAFIRNPCITGDFGRHQDYMNPFVKCIELCEARLRADGTNHHQESQVESILGNAKESAKGKGIVEYIPLANALRRICAFVIPLICLPLLVLFQELRDSYQSIRVISPVWIWCIYAAFSSFCLVCFIYNVKYAYAVTYDYSAASYKTSIGWTGYNYFCGLLFSYGFFVSCIGISIVNLPAYHSHRPEFEQLYYVIVYVLASFVLSWCLSCLLLRYIVRRCASSSKIIANYDNNNYRNIIYDNNMDDTSVNHDILIRFLKL